MRRIAQVLRAGTMSLYWHVASKEHLIDLMLEALMSEVEIPDPSGDWRADLRAYARHHRASLLRHRWVIDYIAGRPGLGPNTLRVVERSLALLAGLGLDACYHHQRRPGGEHLRHGRRAARVPGTARPGQPGATPGRTGAIRRQRQRDGGRLRGLAGAPQGRGGFEHFVEIFDQGVDPDSPATRDERFDFGLDCLLAGIAATVTGGA